LTLSLSISSINKKIKKLKTSDPKEYWKLLNKDRDRKQPNIPLGDLFKFFKNLNKAPDENSSDVDFIYSFTT
jgi:hypothetical protein